MIRVFPFRTAWTPTDPLVYVGIPPDVSQQPKEQPVRISVVFTKDIKRGKQLKKAWSEYYDDVKVGGPAFGNPGGKFVPGRFIKRGVTITSRGCPNRCPWCHVPKREGSIRELPIKRGHIVQDNNLLACSTRHIKKVFQMLMTSDQPVKFSGGLDTRFFKKWHRRWIDQIKLGELWFACDSRSGLPRLESIVPLLKGILRRKRRCFVMVGFRNESISKAEKRIKKVYRMGFDPFAQFYSGPKAQVKTDEWKAFCRTWSRPAAFYTLMKKKRNKR